MAKNRIQYGLYYDTKEEELYAAIPNTANGNCLFESLAYFRDDPSIGLEDYAAILRSDLCEAYKKIINKENLKKDFGYAYQLNKDDFKENPDIRNHWKNICTDKVWAYNSDLTLLSFLMKKVIKLYVRKDNAIRNIEIYPNPNMDPNYDLPDDYNKWNTIQILFSTLDGHQDRGHFEALVLLTADNEEKQIEKIFEEKQKIVSEIDNRGEGDELTPGEKDDILQLSKEEWEKTKPFIIKENSNVIENMIEVAKNTKKKPQVVKPNTSDKKVEKNFKEKANQFIESQANYYNQMIQDKRTEKRETAKIKKDAAKTKKAAKSKAETKTKKTTVAKSKEIREATEAKTKNTTEEDEATDAVARINEKIKQTHDVKEKINTPKNTTRKTITNATPKERERLAIEYTLESEIGNKPKVIVVKPRKTRKLFGNKTIKKIKYKNGDMYIGEVKNNKKHGKGKYIFANGEIYIGEYNNGKRV